VEGPVGCVVDVARIAKDKTPVMADSLYAGVASPTVGAARPDPTRSLGPDPFDRMLLTADGTVTTLLEACTGEPIVTRTTCQAGPASLDRLLAVTGRWWHPDARLLELAAEERLIVRRVTLRGARSGVAYVLAESLVVPGRLPGVVGDRLMRAGASLGRLLAARRLEMRRDILDLVAVRAGAAADHLAVGSSATLARRTYTIAIDRRAVAAVTEWLAPGRLAAMSVAGGKAKVAAWQPFPPADRRAADALHGFEFVTDL
jgi:beta-ribofuranosylaminobenzene 5'-phosphate synthase